MIKSKTPLIAALLMIAGAVSVVNGIAMFFIPRVWFFELVPGLPETGAFNAHLVQDGGTFYLAIGVGLLIAARDPARHLAAIVIAAIANAMHSILHLYSHEAGLLSLDHLATEIAGIYLPTLALIAIAAWISWKPEGLSSPLNPLSSTEGSKR